MAGVKWGGFKKTRQQVSIAYQLSPPGLGNAHPDVYRRVKAQSRHGPATVTEAVGEAGTSAPTLHLSLDVSRLSATGAAAKQRWMAGATV